jgi:hypothetical protein
MIFAELVSKVTGWVSGIPPTLCKDLIKEVKKNIYNERDWSFLFEESYLTIPKLINTGTISINRGSLVGTISNDLKALLDSIDITIGQVDMIGRQIRIRNSASKIGLNRVYTIVGYNSGLSQITLNVPYLDESAINSPIEIFKAYYTAPFYKNNQIDFRSFYAIADLRQNQKINLIGSYADLNKTDPNRTNSGNPYSIYQAGLDSSGNQLFELYPNPKPASDLIYKVAYFRNGESFDEEENIPKPLTSKLFLSAAKVQAYEWAETHKGEFANLMKTSWQNMIVLNSKVYEAELIQCINSDEDSFSQSLIYYDDMDYFGIPDYLMSSESWMPGRDTVVINF